MNSRPTSEINASSMADIGFLLLIFFLVTTTMDTEKGIQKMLPQKDLTNHITVSDKNALEIIINKNDEIMVEGKRIESIALLRQITKDFIDNGAGTDKNGNTCYWCNGKKDPNSSTHPQKAVIKLIASRDARYETYIAVQNEIKGAYNELRESLTKSLYNNSFSSLKISFKMNKTDEKLEQYINDIQDKYPVHIIESTP